MQIKNQHSKIKTHFVLDELAPLRPTIKHAFGFTYVYLGDRLLCGLRESEKQRGSHDVGEHFGGLGGMPGRALEGDHRGHGGVDLARESGCSLPMIVPKGVSLAMQWPTWRANTGSPS